MVHPMKAYQRVRITTASPAELVIMLFEGLVRLTAAAADAIDERRWQDAGRNFEKATEILNHLRESLDDQVAPDLVASLDKTYAAWTMCILRAQIGRDADKARSLVPQMQGMLESWREVANAAPLSVAS